MSMTMAEKSVMLTFQNNCESINSNCVEVVTEPDEKSTNNDITKTTNTPKPEDEPNENMTSNGTQEDAVEKFLAGENKNEFNDDDFLESIDNENDGIEFKSENIIMDCSEIDKGEFFEEDPDDEKPAMSPENSCEENLEGENSECLTKMQIMEDVREGCSVQPSSPGHAEERNNDAIPIVNVDHEENGFDEDSATANVEDLKKEGESDEPKLDNITDLENGDNIKGENSLEANNTNEESSSNTSLEEASQKRKSDSQDSSNKRLRMDIQENFIQRDKILNEFIEMADCSSVDQLQIQTEQILAEIRTLNELAKEKEREWNNIIHLKKMKEELLLRMQRRKQIMMLNGDKNENGEVLFSESQDSLGDRVTKNSSNQSILKANLTNPNKSLKNFNNYEKNKHRNILPKPHQYSQEINGSLDCKQNKQRPVLDVQSIIADYRQRHPEVVPRRGRRIRSSFNDNKNPNNNVLNFSSLALGSGSQVHQNVQGTDINSELGILLNAMESNRTESRPSSAESSTAQEPSFKDMLVQFAKLSQSERHELIQNAIKPPPPYPEVTVHPVPTTTTVAPSNSLLHGILTKNASKANTKTSFSPTLARLLTAPERNNSHSPTTNNVNNAANMSISEILSTSKARNEITITPVAQYENSHKNKANQEDDEAEDSADRLVIDESNEVMDGRGRGDNSSDGGDEVPQCQGCNQKSALFVCAGCGNQWYCSRDCQVSAWDEHSEVCSG